MIADKDAELTALKARIVMLERTSTGPVSQHSYPHPMEHDSREPVESRKSTFASLHRGKAPPSTHLMERC